MRKYSLRAAIAGALTLALVGAGATAANAAPENPAPDSTPTFYLFDENGESAESNLSFTRTTILSMAGDKTDPFVEIMPADYVSAADLATPGLQVWSFVSTAANVNTGTNGWSAWAQSAAAGPNGGVLFGNFTAGELAEGNINRVFQDGGDYRMGLAWTINNGVTVVGKTYRIIHVAAGTSNYTVDAVVEDVPVADVIEESELTGAETVTATTTVDSTIVSLDAGAAHANQTLKVGAFSDRVELGTVTLDAQGKGTVDVAGKGLANDVAHKLFLYQVDGTGNETLAGWGSFTLTVTPPQYGDQAVVDLTATLAPSDRFEIIGAAAWANPVDLGNVRRNVLSPVTPLGAFKVIDDRNVLTGWHLNASAAQFVGATAANVIPASALGFEFKKSGGFQDGVTVGAAKAAGAGTGAANAAIGAALSSTTEEGAILDADLTFLAPVNAARDTYTSTLTLDLIAD